ncbi:MAG: thioredoxin domain-containing protein [Candidatus Omnitrophica bacterium]|nr:thioredoxin domain-containing protein [Candidatus Omnitrophota bacterium]
MALFLPFVFLLGVVEARGAEPAYTNRLIREKSPYLLQHAHNPVDWHPWGEEAFQKAKAEDKPVFLSIGYSTCHWCHVMEEESFSDPKTAEVLNRHFVPIKVDREERPDIDHVYMNYVMATTGSGGWPTSVFLTPQGKPFYGGTYFPPEDRFGAPGFTKVLLSVAQAWKERKGEIEQSAEQAVSLLEGGKPEGGKKELTRQVLEDGFTQYSQSFDPEWGGFGSAPKFPRSHALSFLLRHWSRAEDLQVLEMVEKTLKRMARGGMVDQVGGGFHRYSTDAQWFLPHFEKMLYDQALLARTYVEAYQVTRDEFYARIAREILDYVLREMTSPEGGFYSAQDADSPDPENPGRKREGAFYVWKKSEIEKILPPKTAADAPGKEAALFCFYYGVKEEGSVARDPQGEFKGRNVLFAAHSKEEAASAFRIDPLEVERVLARGRARLLEERSKRPAMHLDDKILTDWNGLMISSFAFAACVLDDARYGTAAVKAADFVWEKLRDKEGRLLHRYREGEAGIPAHLDDYAFLILGYLSVYEATFDETWLFRARELANQMLESFWDEKQGGFFLTSSRGERLIARPKEVYDGAVPSGNSAAALDLLRLYHLTGDRKFLEHAQKIFLTFSEEIASQPNAYPQMLIALDFAFGPVKEIVIAGEEKDPQVLAMVREAHAHFLPNKILLRHRSGEAGKGIETFAPFVKECTAVDGKATAYVCQNYTCGLPVREAKELGKVLVRRS